MRGGWRIVWTTLGVGAAIIAIFVVVMVGLAWWQQERIVFQPPAPPRMTLEPWTTRLDYEAEDGQPLYGFLIVPEGEEPRGAVLAFHGNADLAFWLLPWGRELARRTGHAVFLAEYRGYGGLPGAPTYERSRLDARAAYARLRRALDVPPERIAIFGHSLGSAIATELAAELARIPVPAVGDAPARGAPPRVLILESPFTSAQAMARLIVFRPAVAAWQLISRVHYDTRARVAALELPVWVAHGTRDLVVPVRMGRDVFGAARVPGELLVVQGAGHNDVADRGGEAYWRWMRGALGESATP